MAIKSLGLIAAFAMLSSFSGTWGGDSYRIYVNNKLVLEQFVYNQKEVQTISLGQNGPNDQVNVYYSHCGKTGQSRHLSIRDDKNNLLKEWRYADASNANGGMTCKAKDILSLQATNEKLGMVYSSKELPEGKMLAYVK